MASNQSTGMPPASKRSSSPALGGPMPTLIEENKSLVRRFIHAIEGGDFAVFDEIVSPDYNDHLAGQNLLTIKALLVRAISPRLAMATDQISASVGPIVSLSPELNSNNVRTGLRNLHG